MILSATEVTAFDEVVSLLAPSSGRGVQFEGPQKVGHILEVGSNGGDLMNQILDANDSVLAKLLLNDVIGSDGCSATVLLDKSALVDQLADRLQVGGTPSDEGLC